MPDVPRLRDYQQQTLRDELSKDSYDGMPADEAYLCVTNGLVRQKLASTIYREEDGSVKRCQGFPNKVRRSDFDIIWQELRGSS